MDSTEPVRRRRHTGGRTFVCDAPGAPSDPLGRWWYLENRPPVTIRRIRLTDSPTRAHSSLPAVWPYGWQVTCHAGHSTAYATPEGQVPYVDTAEGRVWMWGRWISAAAFAVDHLRRDPHLTA